MLEASNSDRKKIYIVDDDISVRDALRTIFDLEGYQPILFDRGDQLLDGLRVHGDHPILLDVHMPGSSGLDILSAIEATKYEAPIFIISGQGDIPMAVEAIKAGAHDFIEKPFDSDKIIERVNDGIAKFAAKDRAGAPSFPGADLLTTRESEVLKLIAAGASNKEAGLDLTISPRTIEVHRARIMEKLGAKNAADLVRIVLSPPSQHLPS
ncbi:MAG: response regulator [Hyphomicrobiales bacterium]